MLDDAVKVENVTKTFKKVIYQPTSLKTQVVGWIKRGFRRTKRPTLTVLDNVSFNIKEGYTFGIMGRNGAGKSTLLKLICGIITPTQGYIKTKGKITPLLELGAGFNPELTAKENILINGLILGIPKKVIESKYDEILEFAELESEANEPVRTLSSGMYVRLAFSIAINIDPDIVILDEIMGVGDAHFQHKSRQKIHEFKDKGKTLIIVSHSPDDIALMCDEAMLLEKGRINEMGNAAKVAEKYRQIVY